MNKCLLFSPKISEQVMSLDRFRKSNQNDDIQTPPQDIIEKLISLYNKGESSTIVEQSQLLLQEYPKAFMVWNILGHLLLE